MEAKFNSKTEMMKYIRSVDAHANFEQLIYNDFNVNAENINSVQAKYLWRYFVQGSFEGKIRQELIQYAIEGVTKFAAMFPQYGIGKVGVEQLNVRRGRKVIHQKHNDGIVSFNQKTERFEGWLGGIVVSTGSEAKKVRTRLMKKYKVRAKKINVLAVPKKEVEMAIEGYNTVRNRIRKLIHNK